MRLLVFGRTGQVGREIIRRISTDIGLISLGRSEVDLSYPDRAAIAIWHYKPDAVINAAAWTDVERAEQYESEAFILNSSAPAAMAQQCADMRIPFLHISTDYVFDGRGTAPFKPRDPTSPLSAYGRSKLAGEEKIKASQARHLILRTSWIFSANGKNFVKTMLRLGQEREAINVVSDQIGGPTPAAAIADALIYCARAMVDGHAGGTYHFSGYSDVSWADFARAIMRAAHLRCEVQDISSVDYPTLATRPLNSRLECSNLEHDFNIKRPDWLKGLDEVLRECGVMS